MALVPAFLAAGCASTGGSSDRSRFVAPRQIAEAYSEAELRAMVAVAADVQCLEQACEGAAAFRRQIRELGVKLARSAREIRSDLGGPVPNFIFLVPAKKEIGTLSSAGGNIVVFDGVRSLGLDEPALAFLIAREMGHVISQHHEENSGTSLAVSIIVTLAMPMATVLRGAVASVSAVSSTSAVATAATTAASVAGAQIIKSIYRPDQLRESDLVALKILNQAGWSTQAVAESLLAASDRLREEGWTGELLASRGLLVSMTGATEWPYLAPLGSEGMEELAVAFD